MSSQGKEKLINMFFAPVHNLVTAKNKLFWLIFPLFNGLTGAMGSDIIATYINRWVENNDAGFLWGLLPYDHPIAYLYVFFIPIYYAYLIAYFTYQIKKEKRQRDRARQWMREWEPYQPQTLGRFARYEVVAGFNHQDTLMPFHRVFDNERRDDNIINPVGEEIPLYHENQREQNNEEQQT